MATNKQTGVPTYTDGFPAYPQTRDWDVDFARLLAMDEILGARPVVAGATSPNRVPDKDPNMGGTSQFGGMAAFGGGPKANLIVETAQRLARSEPESTNYYVQPEVACASFVSVVLETAKIIAPSPLLRSTSVADPRRYCPTLPPFLVSAGAMAVIRGTLPLTDNNVTGTLIPGDIIFYYRSRTGRFGHVEIYIGNGLTIGNSSRQQRIHGGRKATVLSSTYQSFTGYRFS